MQIPRFFNPLAAEMHAMATYLTTNDCPIFQRVQGSFWTEQEPKNKGRLKGEHTSTFYLGKVFLGKMIGKYRGFFKGLIMSFLSRLL